MYNPPLFVQGGLFVQSPQGEREYIDWRLLRALQR